MKNSLLEKFFGGTIHSEVPFFTEEKYVSTEKNLTEIVYILDRSGSMGGLESDTIGGFNSMMNKQKKVGEKAFVSTILFDDEFEVLHN
ncbi:MAG: hypothetical protein IJ736_08920, partial [Firmicutes bacterium]|nr:hypothetical protein [Bacillota bacterium]